MPTEEKQGLPRVTVHAEAPPARGELVLEREIPSDTALVKPLVVRTLDFLHRSALIGAEDENEVGLCLEEGLVNAVTHGNKKDFRKKVRLAVFSGNGEWEAVISDEGVGFDPRQVTSPVQGEGLWGESGRGLYLIVHYMERVEFYNGGSTVVMARSCPR